MQDENGKRFRQNVFGLTAGYLADEEVSENELQAAAAGIRTARALEGVLSDPRAFEHNLAERLAPNESWSLRSEASRVPRPSTRPNLIAWSLAPIPWVANEHGWPPAGAETVTGVRQLTGADAEPARVAERPYAGWVQLGMLERQGTLATRYPAVPARRLLISVGLEASVGPPPAGSMPLGSGPPDLWAEPHWNLAAGLDAEHAHSALAMTRGPLAAVISYDNQPGAPARNRGAGLPPLALVPRLEVIALLGLRPEEPALRYALIDDNGPALVGRLWRGFLIHDGNYSPLEPAVHGADLLLRPDLYEMLEGAIGKNRLSVGVVVDHSEHEPSLDEPADVD